MKISNTSRDSKPVQYGRWVGDIPAMEDLRLQVRGRTAPIFVKTLSTKTLNLSPADRDDAGKPTYEAQLRVYGETVAEVGLLDWENLTDDKGKPIPYNTELALKLCTDPDHMPFADAVAYAMNVVDQTKKIAKERSEGNSPALSSGKSTTALAAE